MLLGLPAWRHLASQDEKYAYMPQNIRSPALTKSLLNRSLHPKLCYYMQFPSLQNRLINCFNVSRPHLFLTNILFIIQFVLIVVHFK